MRPTRDEIVRAMHTYAVMYSHETVGKGLQTVNRRWAVYRLDDASRNQPPTKFESAHTEKSSANLRCAELNADAILALLPAQEGWRAIDESPDLSRVWRGTVWKTTGGKLFATTEQMKIDLPALVADQRAEEKP